MIIGNVDNFLENLEKSQLEKGKGPDRLIPVEFDYKGDTNKLIDRMINFLYAAATIAIFYYLFKQLKGIGGSMGKGGGSDIFGIGKTILPLF